MRTDAALSMLSLAAKAGKIKSGEYAVEKAVKTGNARLVIVAGDASEATRKSYRDMCRYHDVDYMEYADKTTLGRTIGKEFRAAVAVCDEGFSAGIAKQAGRAPASTTEVD
ncbi:MAG: ribosomal L7Ae/L30e/S12e/Gadd45 family protein [Lachnospiraceae bacterium]|nr:ribosomal L7Ae/L30e/S12e/Gadd45 family protein [Lachnospiraceae bacterium]